MDETDIRNKLTQVFRRVLRDDGIELCDDMTGWDSVVYINLIVGMETEFAVRFTTQDIHQLTNVGEFVQTISSKLGSGRA